MKTDAILNEIKNLHNIKYYSLIGAHYSSAITHFHYIIHGSDPVFAVGVRTPQPCRWMRLWGEFTVFTQLLS